MAVVTFGFTSTGDSGRASYNQNYTMGSTFTSGANAGTLDKMTAFVYRYGACTGLRAQAALYNGTTLVGASSEVLQSTFPTYYGPIDFTFSGEPILASTAYNLVLMMEIGDSNNYMYFSRNNSGGTMVYYSAAYASFANPATWSPDTRKMSIYATYTEGGGASFQSAWANNSNAVLKVM